MISKSSNWLCQLIAHSVLPDAVEGNDYVENKTGLPEDEPEQNGKTMNSNAVLAHAVKAIQEQQELIEALQKEVEELKVG